MKKLFELDLPKQAATRKFSLCLIDLGAESSSRFVVAVCFNGKFQDRGDGFYTDSPEAAFQKFTNDAYNLLDDYGVGAYEFYREMQP